VTQQVNLYNPALVPKADLFSGRMVLLDLAAVLLLSLVGVAWSSLRAANTAQEEQQVEERLAALRTGITNLSQQVAAHRASAQLSVELASLDALLAGRNEVIQVLHSGVLGDTKGVSEYFRAFARQTLDGVWLTGFSITGAGTDVVIEGRTLRAELVPTYIRMLRREEVLRGHAFGALRVEKPVANLAANEAHKTAEFLEFRLSSRVPESPASPTSQEVRK
jgi:hypothetical protein